MTSTPHWRVFDVARATPSAPNELPGNTAPLVGRTPWSQYVEDRFDKIVWRWKYNLEFDEEPHGLTPFCPECGLQLVGQRYVDGRTGGYAVHLECRFHKSVSHESADDDYPHIKKLIVKKRDDNSWIETVNQQRMARGESPISLPTQIPNTLGEEETQILRALAGKGGDCDKYQFKNALEFLRFHEKMAPLEKVALAFHLHRLEEQKFISITKSARGPDEYCLTQKGRQYVLENKLGIAEEDSQ